MRSLLFVPGDSERKFAKAITTEADALILDLEDSVAKDRKVGARAIVRQLLETHERTQKVFVRVNALDTGLTLDDICAVLPGRPDGIVLPKCVGAADIDRLALYLDALEAAFHLPARSVSIIAIVTETAEAVLRLISFGAPHPRLWGIMWGAEDLAASLGASGNRENGQYRSPFVLARDLCLMAAAAAGVVAIDTVATEIDNLAALKDETIAARRDGFSAKALIHPKQVEVVNTALSPTEEELNFSRAIVEAFKKHPDAGVLNIEGRMVDVPHLRAAKRLLSLAERRK